MEWTHRLRMRQLYLLVALFETRNVSHTAAQMGVTQPGLSKWLNELETDLNVKLFKRNSRGLTPTEFCTALVGHARAIIGELDRTQATIRVMSIGASGNLVVGTTPTVATGVVPRAAGYFRKRFPDAYLNIIESPIDALLPELQEGRVDLIVTRTDQVRLDAGVRCDTLYPEQIRIVVGARHPLSRKRKVAWSDVLRYPWIIPPKTSPLRRELEHELALAGQPSPRYRVETGSTLESWQFGDMAGNLVAIPIWIPQMGFVIGTLIFLIAVLDECVTVLRGGKPSYVARVEERHARGDFSEEL